MSNKIKVSGAVTYFQYCILDEGKRPVVLSIYDRSEQIVKSVWASLHRSKIENYDSYGDLSNFPGEEEPFLNHSVAVTVGKERFYHMITRTQRLNKSLFLCERGCESEAFYHFLMNNFNYPIMYKWSEAICDYAISKKKLIVSQNVVKACNDDTYYIKHKDKLVNVDDMVVVSSTITSEWIEKALQELYQKGTIFITTKKQPPLLIDNLDSYYNQYGPSIVENLMKQITPLMDLTGNIDNVVLKNIRLFPQQIAQVRGAQELLHKHKNYCFQIEGMGTGKTIQAVAITSGLKNMEYLNSNPKATLKDCYETPSTIGYRAMVMPPGHLVEKWAKEVRENVPYAKVQVLTSFEDVLALRELPKKPECPEWYIMGKDFAKLSYSIMPIPSRVRKRQMIYKKMCATPKCRTIIGGSETSCPQCKGNEISYFPTDRYAEGLACPDCGKLLLPSTATDLSEVSPLMPWDFDAPRKRNSTCYYCGSNLWGPHVANVNTDFFNVTGFAKREPKWYKISHYTNRAKKGKKASWVLKGYEESFLVQNNVEKIENTSVRGTRKYSPATFIKKYLKNFADVAIFDEAHLYKGGGTAQGNAMHALVKASKKQLALTGTIANGYASSMFYLLFRLDPARMIRKGYTWTDVTKFTEAYGTIEYNFLSFGGHDEKSRFNSGSRGRQLKSPKTKTGISPLIFTEFMLDCSIFLDLSDMSKFMPKLVEKVITLPCEQEVIDAVKEVTNAIEPQARREGGSGLWSSLLQFNLSYADKPMARLPILHPLTGDEVVEIPDLSHLTAGNNMLAKEKALVDTVRAELDEGRNCMVFCEFTNSAETIVTNRLKYLLEREIGIPDEVCIIESGNPCAREREAWMHKRAAEGIRVFITNPKNVETGLDLVWKDSAGKEYNFPTICFYQVGYNLFTTWQASRRHYRLSQRKECRTYYFAYENTIQTKLLELVSEKICAVSAIQGRFSAEGLASLAKGVDVKLQLAQALSAKDTVTGNRLQEMYDVIGAANEDSSEEEYLSDYVPMMLFSELMGADFVDSLIDNSIVTSEEINIDISVDNDGLYVDNFSKFYSAFASLFNEPNTGVVEPVASTEEPATDLLSNTDIYQGKKKKNLMSGQLLLF